jgi:hypothetical protein
MSAARTSGPENTMTGIHHVAVIDAMQVAPTTVGAQDADGGARHIVARDRPAVAHHNNLAI